MSFIRVAVPSFVDYSGILAFRDGIARLPKAELDFSGVGFAFPDGMVLLARIISDRIAEGAELRAVSYEHASYPRNMGFFEGCGFNLPPEGYAPGNSNYFPLKVYKSQEIISEAERMRQHPGEFVNSLAGKLAKIMIRGKDEKTQETITYSIREIVRNIIEHSESENFLVSGQYYPYKGVVEIAIMDRGIGIRGGLSSNPHLNISSDYEAIIKALVPGISGRNYRGMPKVRKTEWSNSGFGLYMTSQICRMGGQFLIGSGDNLVRLSANEKSVHPFGFNGTLISMVLKVTDLPKLIGLLQRLSDRGERIAKLVKVEADVEASYASKFIVGDDSS